MFSTMWRVLGVLAGSALAVGVAAAPAAAATTSGPVFHTTVTGLRVRSGPSTNYRQLGVLGAAGSPVKISCWYYGQSIVGDSIWYRISTPRSGYVSGYYVDTGRDPNPAIPRCGGALPGDRCTPSSLRLSLGPVHGAAGSYSQELRFTNTSGRPCTMHGFPGVSYVTGDAGTQVGAPAQRVSSAGPTITLQPGQVAHADLRSVFVRNYPPKKCDPTHVRGLRVYPPNDFYAMYIPRPGTGCANASVTQLSVRTAQPGPGR
jgi:hypothetical protein